LSTAQLSSYAARLGSDCSFFVYDKPMLGKGRGELLSPVAVNLKGKFIVLVNPGIHVSTAAAYAGVSPVRPQTTLEEILTQVPLVHWRHELKNDFEKSVFKLHPAIQKIKETLYAQGAQYACMSGSGSTVFAIFEQEVDLKNCFTDCQYWSGILS
jgi:4-diphosphocytidyl-2-C-methyl-D-erythritol kinase